MISKNITIYTVHSVLIFSNFITSILKQVSSLYTFLTCAIETNNYKEYCFKIMTVNIENLYDGYTIK